MKSQVLTRLLHTASGTPSLDLSQDQGDLLLALLGTSQDPGVNSRWAREATWQNKRAKLFFGLTLLYLFDSSHCI